MRVPALSPYTCTSKLGFAAFPWVIGCSGSSALFTLGAFGSIFQSSRKNREGNSIRVDLCGSCLGGGGPPGPPRRPCPSCACWALVALPCPCCPVPRSCAESPNPPKNRITTSNLDKVAQNFLMSPSLISSLCSYHSILTL